ncbi:MAG TPA: c-type cytochrome [Pyrinomonadaceae bacterium]|jgi:cytochrome c oxidase cbb3-type subunit 3|nr:c-type cytochrome [Pyrinomonadaceae bacterium]
MGRRFKRAAFALSLLLLPCIVSGGGYFGRLADASAAQKSKLAGKQTASAKVLYADNCARCHGADARGQTAMGRAFAAPNLTDAGWWKKERPSDKRLTASIRDGRGHGRMPAFGQQLSKSDIAALVRLVRTFGGK